MAKWKANAGVEIEPIASGLFAISCASTPRLRRFSYFLVREAGNLLFHGPDHRRFYESQRGFFDAHGGIALQVLTHAPEASPACSHVIDTWGAPICVRECDRADVERKAGCRVEAAFTDRHILQGGDVEAIPLPGHTMGFTVYRFERGDVGYLLSGDMIVPQIKGWRAKISKLLLEPGARSVRGLGDLEADWLLPNQCAADLAVPVPFDPEARRPILEQVFEDLRKKGVSV